MYTMSWWTDQFLRVDYLSDYLSTGWAQKSYLCPGTIYQYLDSCNCFYRKQQECKNITRYMGILLKRHLAKVFFVFRYFFCLLNFLPTIFGVNRIFGLWWCWWWWYWLLKPDVSRARCNKCNFGFSQQGPLTIRFSE